MCRLPSHTSHKLQPCDVGPFAPLKAAYRDEVERLDRGGVNTIGKQHFTSLYSPARLAAFTTRNIIAGWSKSGLTPLNPHRVLKDMEKPLPELPEAAGELTLVPRGPLQGNPALPTAPVTPVTPVTAEAFTSLQDLILERDAHALDDTERQSLQRHLQKLTKAAKTSIARSALQQERIQFLLDINNEAKVRRSTKSLVLGKARVMSYKDLEAARANRAEKEASKATKNKRGGKCKGGTRARGTCMLGTAAEAAQIEAREPADITLQVAGTEADDSLLAPCPGRAPVAQMW